MPGDLNYATEKYTTAALKLVRSEGPELRDRLREAVVDQLVYATGPVGGGPGGGVSDHLWARMEELLDRLNNMPAVVEGRGTISTTFDLMSDEEIDDAAAELLHIAFELVREHASRRK